MISTVVRMMATGATIAMMTLQASIAATGDR